MLKRKNLKQTKKIVVHNACSLENEIRLYISKDYYAVAREETNGDISVCYEIDHEEEREEIIEEIKQYDNLFTRLFSLSKEMIKNIGIIKVLLGTICE